MSENNKSATISVVRIESFSREELENLSKEELVNLALSLKNRFDCMQDRLKEEDDCEKCDGCGKFEDNKGGSLKLYVTHSGTMLWFIFIVFLLFWNFGHNDYDLYDCLYRFLLGR